MLKIYKILPFLFLIASYGCNDPLYNRPLTAAEKQEILTRIKIIETDTSRVQWLEDQILKETDSAKLIVLKLELYSCLNEREGADYFKIKNAVPDEKTASDVAYIYLCNYYGAEMIKAELPLLVTSVGDYWYVEGSFNHGKGWAGGVAEIALEKRSGKVIYVIHGK
jgi:hypothetical protein